MNIFPDGDLSATIYLNPSMPEKLPKNRDDTCHDWS